jgi:hypothetical protein
MKIRNSLLLLMALAVAGCWQKSVSPFYTANDLVAEPALAGVWQEPTDANGATDKDRPVWEFVPGDGKRFDLVIRNSEERHAYDAFVFKLGADRYLDLVSIERPPSGIPAHHLFKLIRLSPDLQLAALNPDWMRQQLRQKASLAHVLIPNPEHRGDRDQDELVLTADTAALQKFIREHRDQDDLFVEPIKLQRHSNAASTAKK